jgi:hypothetical protein
MDASATELRLIEISLTSCCTASIFIDQVAVFLTEIIQHSGIS